jgi:aspartate/methionine/tyrosine aminotransferase
MAKQNFGGLGFLRWVKRIKQMLAALPPDSFFDLIDSEVALSASERQALLDSEDFKNFVDRRPNRLDLEFYSGHPCLKSALARQLGVSPDQIVPVGGASLAMTVATHGLIEDGDEVVIEEPTYGPFIAAVRRARAGTPHYWQRTPTFQAKGLTTLLEQIKRPRVLIVSNLHNPTGWQLEPKDYQALAGIARSFGLTIIVDEIFRDLAPPFGSIPKPAAAIDPCFISLSSLSKIYGRSDLRCGWIIASSDLALERLTQAQIDFENYAPPLTQGLASLVVEDLPAHRLRAVEVLIRNRQIVRRHLQPLIDRGLLQGDIPEYSSVYFPKLSRITDASAFVEQLAAACGVFIVPGSLFGAMGHVRIGFGCDPETLDRGLERLAGFIKARG